MTADTVAIKPQRCGDCVSAAFDDAGVYCKEFHESILNERVAEDCGVFEERVVATSTPVVLNQPIPDPLVRAKRSTLALEKDWQDHSNAPVTAYTPVELEAALPFPSDMTGLVGKFEDYLSLMHCQLWGGSFNIWDEEGRHKAALWLAEVMTEALGGNVDAEGT